MGRAVLQIAAAVGLCSGVLPLAAAVSAKKGGGLGGANYTSQDLSFFNFEWYYDWTLHTRTQGEAEAHGMEFVPMVWGKSSLRELRHLHRGATHLLGFNEPNIITQANLTPKEACELWPQLEETGLRLGSPGVDHCHYTSAGHCTLDPYEWLAQFFGNCSTARVDFLAVHYYGCEAAHVVDFVKEGAARFGRPVWLTEFACSYHNETVNMKFMKALLPQLEALPSTVLERYAWYATRTNQPKPHHHHLGLSPSYRNNCTELLRGGKLTALGEYYNSL